MTTDFASFLRRCLLRLIEPVAEFCVARGCHFPDFVEAAKIAFVRAAERRLRGENAADPSVNRLSAMTGIQRPEVGRILRSQEPEDSKDSIIRVVGQWTCDRRFLDSRRRPRALRIEGTPNEFKRLVHTVSRGLNPHTVRFELERLGLAKCAEGKVTLLHPVYLTSGDPAKTLELAAEDARDLLAACEENAFIARTTPNLHARTTYDNIPDEALPKIREWCLTLGAKIHKECREFFSRFDRDINANVRTGAGRNRVVLGTFSRVEPFDVPRKDKKE